MSGGLLSLKWNNHQSTFLHVLSSLCLNDTLSDVTLACEGEFYAAHRLVLATCSEYFEKIFEKIEGKHSVIVLKDVKAEEIEALLNYMYEGEVNVMQEKLSGLIKAAEFLKVKGLSDSDEAPEMFSRQIFKRNKRRGKSSHDPSSSPSAKRKRKDTDTSDPPPQSDVGLEAETEHPQGAIPTGLEACGSPKEVEGPLQQNENQNYEAERLSIKEEPGTELKNELFNFTDESSQFLAHQNEYIPQISDISVPSVSSQLDGDKDPNSACNIDEGSSTSSNLWEAGNDLQNLTNSTRISHCFETDAGAGGGGGGGERMTITPADILPLLSEEDEDLAGLRIAGGGGGGTFSCPYCPFKTFQKNVHDTHLRRHASEKTFFCQFCSYSCMTKSNLKCHIRKHTGEKPFACPHCNYRSAQSSNIKIHVRRMHKSDAEEEEDRNGAV